MLWSLQLFAITAEWNWEALVPDGSISDLNWHQEVNVVLVQKKGWSAHGQNKLP